ncbi:hypothetical protein JOM56_000398 [Amanita muscaria]
MTFLRKPFILTVAFSMMCGALAMSALTVNLSGPDIVQALSRFVIVAIIKNAGDKPVCLVNNPNSLISDLPTDKFRVVKENDDKIPVFKGIRVKFVPRTAAAMGARTCLSPGESINVPHDVNQIYDFSTSGQGSYVFSPASVSFLVVDGERISHMDAQVHAISVLVSEVVTGTIPSLSQAFNNISKVDEPSYIGCTPEQQDKIKLAVTAVKSYASEAYESLEALNSNSKRFEDWFGEPSKFGFSTVHSHYGNLKNENYMSFTYDCTCNLPTVFAYVRPAKHGVIHLCQEFWAVSCMGTDSQAGTILHETSHFQQNGGTFDYAYGQDDSMQLAIDDPNEAAMNADSHEYFAENPDTKL